MSASGLPRTRSTLRTYTLYPDTAEAEDFSYQWLLGLPTRRAGQQFQACRRHRGPLLQGAAALAWPGSAHVMRRRRLVLGRVGRRAGDESAGWQRRQGTASKSFAEIRNLRARHPDGENARISQSLVAIPKDSTAPQQREKYVEHAHRRAPPRRRARRGYCPHETSSITVTDRRATIRGPCLPKSRRGCLRTPSPSA